MEEFFNTLEPYRNLSSIETQPRNSTEISRRLMDNSLPIHSGFIAPCSYTWYVSRLRRSKAKEG
jgi:hypothetical protein